jgi:hypothetical protein
MGTDHIPDFLDNCRCAAHAELQFVLDHGPLVAVGVELGVFIQEVVLELHCQVSVGIIIYYKRTHGGYATKYRGYPPVK